MMAAKFQDYAEAAFNGCLCDDKDIDCYHNTFLAIEPRKSNEVAGFDLDFPEHLRGLTKSELEFLDTLRDKRGHRCKKSKTSPSTFRNYF